MDTDTDTLTEVHAGAMPSATGSTSGSVAVAPAPPAGPPSVHVRAVITWLAIFPLVAIGMMLIAPFAESWHPVLRAFALTLVVVPLAVYVVVPQLMRAYGALRRRRAGRDGSLRPARSVGRHTPAGSPPETSSTTASISRNGTSDTRCSRNQRRENGHRIR